MRVDLTTLHPLFCGLFEILPPPGAIWPMEQRRRWLDVAEYAFDLLYGEPADEVDSTDDARAALGEASR